MNKNKNIIFFKIIILFLLFSSYLIYKFIQDRQINISEETQTSLEKQNIQLSNDLTKHKQDIKNKYDEWIKQKKRFNATIIHFKKR
ncbi:hypothetical protein [Vaccinium witches'-broom phytoplasma]|uniref:hypothetical protein n=1 Tax=Vaccinium witches'-broom phytoplasma TaxID=85642 RepID=UPI00035F6065|nr:hypothetical protein [Vaccinium witches'-broom phytoplasma]